MVRRSICLAALAGLAFLAATAPAQDIDLMQFADADHDGKVSRAEFTAFSEQGWTYFAQGADKVKVADLDPIAAPAFAGAVPDAAGQVSKDAYMQAVPERFTAADVDHDGSLSEKELNDALLPH